jgi:hypothetical protein
LYWMMNLVNGVLKMVIGVVLTLHGK